MSGWSSPSGAVGEHLLAQGDGLGEASRRPARMRGCSREVRCWGGCCLGCGCCRQELVQGDGPVRRPADLRMRGCYEVRVSVVLAQDTEGPQATCSLVMACPGGPTADMPSEASVGERRAGGPRPGYGCCRELP